MRYRKIEVRIWNDAKFRSLSKDGMLVFLFVLTHPNLTQVGTLRATIDGLASELPNFTPKGFAEGFRECLAKGLLKADEKACLIVAPNFLKHNRPENPNVVKSWAHIPDLTPECDLRDSHFAGVVLFVKGLSKGFVEALPEGFAKPYRKGMAYGMPNQEQEQEQEQEQQTPLPPVGDAPVGAVCVAAIADPPEPSEPPPTKSPYSADFMAVWPYWPPKRRGGRAPAWKAWEACRKAGELPDADELIAFLRYAADSDQWTKDGGQYQPAPAVILNGRRWEGWRDSDAWDPPADSLYNPNNHSDPSPETLQMLAEFEAPGGPWEQELAKVAAARAKSKTVIDASGSTILGEGISNHG